MDVSYSAWQQSNRGKEPLALKGESFSFLFDRRYTNRLNRMSRVFFEAYAKATMELAATEDRFPSLSEVEAKMESGAVYAFKDRLMKSTEFFEEVKISGVSYLVPKAQHFVDATGTYTDLAFDFEAGSILLPARRKTRIAAEPSGDAPADVLTHEAADAVFQAEDISSETAGAQPAGTDESGSLDVGLDSSGEPPLKTASDAATQPPFRSAKEVEGAAIATGPEPAGPADTAIAERAPDREGEAEPGQPAAVKPEPQAETGEIPSLTPVLPAEQATTPSWTARFSKFSGWKIGLVAVVILAAVIGLTYSDILSPLVSGSVNHVKYISYLSNGSLGDFLALEIENPSGVENELELILPPDVDKSISARGGVVTISDGDGTQVRLSSRSDASVRIYLVGNPPIVPVMLNLTVPKGYNSGLDVQGKSYDVSKKEHMIILKMNVTAERVEFEQSYRAAREI